MYFVGGAFDNENNKTSLLIAKFGVGNKDELKRGIHETTRGKRE